MGKVGDFAEALESGLSLLKKSEKEFLKGLKENMDGDDLLLSVLTDSQCSRVQKGFNALSFKLQAKAIGSTTSNPELYRNYLLPKKPITQAMLLRELPKEQRKNILRGYHKNDKVPIIDHLKQMQGSKKHRKPDRNISGSRTVSLTRRDFAARPAYMNQCHKSRQETASKIREDVLNVKEENNRGERKLSNSIRDSNVEHVKESNGGKGKKNTSQGIYDDSAYDDSSSDDSGSNDSDSDSDDSADDDIGSDDNDSDSDGCASDDSASKKKY